MNKQYRLFKFLGVPVYAHWTFFLLLIFIGYTIGWILGLAIILSVFLHEFGHILVARRYGIGTNKVVMFGLGMAAMLFSIPKKQEMVIALAGPAVNFAITLLLIVPIKLMTNDHYEWLMSNFGTDVVVHTMNLLRNLAVANFALGAFNMFPIYPLDGGRALRGMLSRWYKRPKATKIVAIIGTVITACIMPFVIVTGDIALMLILPFIIVYAWREVKYLQRHGERSGLM